MASKYLAVFSLWALLNIIAAQKVYSTNFAYSVRNPYFANLVVQNSQNIAAKPSIQAAQNAPQTQNTPSNPSVQNTPYKLLVQTSPKNRVIQNNVYASTQLQSFPDISTSASGYGEFSICFFINLKSFLSATQQVPLLAYMSGNSTEIIFHFDYARQATGICIGNGNGNAVFLPFLPPANQWTHICLTWHGNYGLVNIYVDGQSASAAHGIKTDYRIPDGGTWNLAKSLTDIGQVTQLHFWNRVLSSTEVQQAQTCSLSGNILSWEETDMGFKEVFTSFYDDSYPCINQPSTAEENICPDHPTTSVLDLDKLDDGSETYYVSGYFEKTLHHQKNFTVCAWFYREELADIPALQVMDGNDVYIFQLAFKEDDSIYVRMGDDKKFDERSIDRIDVDFYDWQHYCFAWTISNGRAEFYVNGDFVHVERNFMAGYSLSAGSHLEVQQLQYENADKDDPTEGFAFKTTDVNLWEYVLSEDEVKRVYSCSGSLPGNVLSWENDQFEYDDEWIAKTCGVPVTTSFLDATDYSSNDKGNIEFISYIQPSVAVKDALSVCGWVIPLDPTKGIFVYHTYQVTNDFGLFLTTQQPSSLPPELAAGFYGGIIWTTEYTIPLNEWHHFCFTWQRSNGNANMYVDGELKAQIQNFATGSIFHDGESFSVSQYQNGPADKSNPTKGFANKITDVNLWSYVITEKEVSDAYCGKAYGDVINKDSKWGKPIRKPSTN